MKRFLILSVALLICFAQAFASTKADKKKTVAEVTFVTTVECRNCVKKVEANLPFEQGVKDIKINLDDRTVRIKYDAAKTDPAKLASAIRKLGFDAVELK